MASTFFGLDIAVSGMHTTMAQITTASHNIANSETDGYCRQVVSTQASEPLRGYCSAGMIGTGVVATAVTQERDFYYDEKYWDSNSMKGEYEAVDTYLTSIETYLNEVSDDGFTTMFDGFFNSLSSLANDASSLEKRTEVTSKAQTFVEYLNNVYNNLQSVQDDINTEIKNQVDRINSISKEIAALNDQIATLEVYGEVANDLRDQRAVLIDELSTYGTVDVKETVVNKTKFSLGQKMYNVKFNGQILVSNENRNELKCVPRSVKDNQNDIDGLYDIIWEKADEELNLFSTGAHGSLSALMMLRDGNNQANLNGYVTASPGDNKITITDTNINDISRINVPIQGKITIGGMDYEYTNFEVKVEEVNGVNEYTYEFELLEPVVKNINNREAHIGETIDFKGANHYMTQINEFLRTFSKRFNEIHNKGEDLNGNKGEDLFVYNDDVSARQHQLSETDGDNGFKSTDATYYRMTAGNAAISNNILKSSDLFAAATEIDEGFENNEIVSELLSLKTDVDMFKEGKPADFLNSVVAEIGVDKMNYKKLAENQSNITYSIDTQRMSISSVDVDEEGMNVVRYQQAYEMSARVFTIMNEIYNTLIKELGI